MEKQIHSVPGTTYSGMDYAQRGHIPLFRPILAPRRPRALLASVQTGGKPGLSER
jgi:hypothetical protein